MSRWAEMLTDDAEAMLQQWDYERDDTIRTMNLPIVAAFRVEVEGEKYVVKIEREP